jgi:quercetin dioxygenase-like cupin family protein
MTGSGPRNRIAVILASLLVVGCAKMPGQDTPSERSRIALSHKLPELDGSHLKMTAVEVTYAPGKGSEPHSHPCVVLGYVIEGALRTQVRGEPEVVYQAGQSFYEAPNTVHQISTNASRKEPVRFLACFVCDRDTPLSVSVP